MKYQQKNGYLIKKGHPSFCFNYQGIKILSIPEVLNRILLNRMKDAVDPTSL
ncbi:hypothetical protein DPMN_108533 [Dreissena polymorpha]|uniref:Uncharacterized protein n=1 Tax=Dreissena polymorpha TaxID=45954 RepID=A0A9D4QL32_DREPO|nr:hypothetical protein DPMN_108533 [Dreissena polymorpha]